MPARTLTLSSPALLALALSPLGCSSDLPAALDDTAAAASWEAPATAHWMADTFADRPDTALGRILLPGAFNSSSYACAVENGMSPDAPDTVRTMWGTDGPSANDEARERIVGWAKTQGRPLGQQLEDGIRWVEINLTVKEGELVTWHSVYGVPVGEVLDEVVAFAVAWPEEVVVVHFGLTVDEADWPLFGEALEAPRTEGVSMCDLFYDGTEDVAGATLGDIRASGRNLVLTLDGDARAYVEGLEDCPLSRGGRNRTWSITTTTEGVAEALAASVDSRDPEALLINDFVFSLSGYESTLDQVSTISAYPGVQEASVDLGFAGDFPERLIAEFDGQANMNVFAGAYYEDTTLVEAAVVRNGER